jgi:uncharacterized protein (TIGR02246 family)
MEKTTSVVLLLCGVTLVAAPVAASPAPHAQVSKPAGDHLAPWHRWWDRLSAELAQAEAGVEIARLLAAQSRQWTEGDLDAFCSVYADDATFLSPSGLTRGRAEILARYKRRYDTAQKRGRLSLKIVEIWTAPTRDGHVTGASAVLRWHLSRSGQADASGLSLIVLRATSSGWVIEQDASM